MPREPCAPSVRYRFREEDSRTGQDAARSDFRPLEVPQLDFVEIIQLAFRPGHVRRSVLGGVWIGFDKNWPEYEAGLRAGGDVQV